MKQEGTLKRKSRYRIVLYLFSSINKCYLLFSYIDTEADPKESHATTDQEAEAKQERPENSEKEKYSPYKNTERRVYKCSKYNYDGEKDIFDNYTTNIV